MRSALLVLAGCGRIAFVPGNGDADAGVDAPLGEFATPALIPSLSDPLTDDDPTATGDALEMYFASERIGMAGGYADIYVSMRPSRDQPWGPPQNVTQLNSADEDQSPGVSADGLTIYFSSRRPSPLGGTSSNIWMATRTARGDAWSAPVFVMELSTTLDEFEPQPDATDLHLVLYRHISTVNRDLYEADRASIGATWNQPLALASLNAPGSERSPCLARGGFEIWFGSDRASGTQDVHDIFHAARTGLTAQFDPAELDTALSSPADDDDPWVSPDGHVILFSSTRSGNPEIYEAQR